MPFPERAFFAETLERETILAATSKLRNTQTNTGIEVQYTVVLKLAVAGASDITMSIPFVMESPRPSTPAAGVWAVSGRCF